MGSKPTKAANNIYCQARMEASTYDDRLKSREKAAEMMGYDPSTVAGWELGSSRPSPEAVLIMSDRYNAPHLCNHFCASECPLGSDTPELITGDLDRITLRALGAMKDLRVVKDTLIEITADGKIDETELQELEEILAVFDELSSIHNSLKNWYQKHSHSKKAKEEL